MSRTTLWRHRQRAKKFINDDVLNDASLEDHLRDEENNIDHDEDVATSELQSNNQNDYNAGVDQCINDLINDNNKSKSIEHIQEEPNELEYDSNSEIDELDNEEIFNLSAEPTVKDIAAVLIVLKIRHRLSNRCIDHLCQLMRILKTPNVPSNFAHIKSMLVSEETTNFTPTKFFCSSCKSMSDNEKQCCNPTCKESSGFSAKPNTFVRIPLRSQIQNVLSRFPSSYFEKVPKFNRDYPSDISQGEVYKEIVKKENNFITLLMNVDGIEIATSSKSSLWVISFVINELKKKERFQIQNVLVGGIGAGRSKPSRAEMGSYLRPIVNELLGLQREHRFRTSDGVYLTLKVYLIAGSFDKPAQALVQNIGEANGGYGCGRCCIMGITVPINNDSSKKIRVFPLRRNENHPKLRSNFTYDVKMAIPEHYRPKEKYTRRDFMHGYLGECSLRELRYFDVGRGFAFDTLHNLYRGTFSRMLDLWFESTYRKEPWSLYSKIKHVDIRLSTHKFPSTTCRIPRSILKYNQFKANELRSVLLFGFSSFSFLPRKYYRHFVLLVIAAHLCESRSISPDQLSYIRQLTTEFVYQFPLLYGDRQNVMCIHLIVHLADSIKDFGGVYNYSTFNFESYLGTLRETVHSTRRHALEVNSNIGILRSSCLCINETSFNLRLKEFIKRIQPAVLNDRNLKFQNSDKVKNIDYDKLKKTNIQSLFGKDITLYKTMTFKGVRYTTVMYQTISAKNDSCVMYKLGTKIRIGFIISIIKKLKHEQECIIEIRDVPINRYLSVNINGTNITCSNIMFSSSTQSNSSYFVRPSDMIEKLSYVFDNSLKAFILFRFPNMIESS
ncbi:unnamed protein product [Rotaria magnacalcarata]|uniref:Transposase domain-containing protein n=1 Tax=Rotaria magnacalcarata TaxID=392030 RepID=A0A816M6T4_9BILA|nr:unnamed protein product [Rotaria magnacalcarata]